MQEDTNSTQVRIITLPKFNMGITYRACENESETWTLILGTDKTNAILFYYYYSVYDNTKKENKICI